MKMIKKHGYGEDVMKDVVNVMKKEMMKIINVHFVLHQNIISGVINH